MQEAVLAKKVFFQWGYAEMPYIEFLLRGIKLESVYLHRNPLSPHT